MPTLKGKWCFKYNKEPIMNSDTYLSQTIEFIISGDPQPFYSITVENGYINIQDQGHGGNSLYVPGDGWVSPLPDYLDFGETPQEVSEDFYNWFTKNAVNLQPTGTWRFNKTLTDPGTVLYSYAQGDAVIGTAHDTETGSSQITRISYDPSIYLAVYDIEGDGYNIWYDGSWYSEEARVITFIDQNLVSLNPEFALWFYENAHSMELKLYSECYIAETADKIRKCANDNTLTFKVSDLADGVQTAYDTGYSHGIAENYIALQTKTVSPSSTSQTVRPDIGYDGLSSVTVNPCLGTTYISSTAAVSVAGKANARISSTERNKIIPSNIKSGVDILGVTGTYSGSAPQTCTVELYISADQGANCEIHYMNEDGTFATYYSSILTNPGYKTINLTVQRNSLLALVIEKTRPNFSLGGSDGDGGLEGLQMISKTTGLLSQGIAIYKVLNKDYAREELVFTN